ncbi:MAG: DUF839 domain-containing protein [Flavobacteriales bacterium]|nr:DUF839 domain-containing protein [Flavobacteriales bacterium]
MHRSLVCASLLIATCTLQAQSSVTGCSSSGSPYMLATAPGVSTTSLLTTGNMIGGYRMVGTPDGLGAYDNGDGTFTVLMNHEMPSSAGVVRAHGGTGAFVSKWVFDKTTLCVLSGQDLMQSVYLWNGSSFVASTVNFNRFCSADLPAPTAFFNASTGLGTQMRIHMNGEEGGTEGRAVAHIVSGPNARRSYQLPHLGRANWENVVASPTESNKTVVGLMDDTAPGQVYFYVGTKQSTGTEIAQAGLLNGNLYGVAVSGLTTEVSASFPAPGTSFSLIDLGNVSNISGAQLNTNSNAVGITNFLRPEDGAWDPANPSDFYFTTTNSFSAPSRLWKLHFTNVLQPELGGTITAVLGGTEGQKMLDNLTIDPLGNIFLCEDVGNNAHLGKIWRYDIATDILTQVAQHDPARFLSGGANYLTQNEEATGILDVSAILGEGKYLFNVMAHYTTNTELYEGGQLLLINTGTSKLQVNARTILEGPYNSTTGLMGDALRTLPNFPLSAPYPALGLPNIGGGVSATTPAILSVTGNNAIVDWVVVELRSTAATSTVLARRSALLQRDGDVVDLNGVSPLSFDLAVGNYHVAVRHRNHMGCMTAAPVALSTTTATVDLTLPGTGTYGTNARKNMTGAFPAQALWAGDVSLNGQIQYTGSFNDRDPILARIGGVVATNTVVGYYGEDLSMDASVMYTGQGNDRDIILVNIGGTVATEIRYQQLP